MKPGTLYYWYVEIADLPRVALGKHFFKVLPKVESDKLTKILESILKMKTVESDGTYLVLMSRILLENSLFQDGLEKLVNCYKMAPGDEGLTESIERTYKAMGFFPDDIARFIKMLKEKYPSNEDDDKAYEDDQQTKPK